MSQGRQHRVPQFYLRFFRSPKGKNWIFQGSISDQTWRERKISEVEASYDYYGSEQDEETQKLEDEAARVLRRLATCNLPMRLREGDRWCISRFVFHQMMRVEALRQMFLDAEQYTWEKLASDGHYTKEQIAEPLQILDELRTEEKAVLPRWIDPDGGEHSPMEGFDVDRLASQAAQSGRFRIAVAPEGSAFITSDNPVTFHALTHPFGAEGAVSLAKGRRKLSIFFPLSSTRAVMIGGVPYEFKRTTAFSVELSEQEVVVFNEWTARMASKYIYATAPVNDVLEYAADRPRPLPFTVSN